MKTAQWAIFLLENALTEGKVEGCIVERVDTGRMTGSTATFKIDRRSGRLAGSDSVVLEELYGEMRDLCQPSRAVKRNAQMREVGAVDRVMLGLVPEDPQSGLFKQLGSNLHDLLAELLPLESERAVAS